MSDQDEWPQPKSPYGLTSRQKDFAYSVARTAALYSSPVIISNRQDSELNTASGFLFKPADMTFLITNSHVVECFRQYQEKYGDEATFTFGNETFDPRVVAEEPDEFIDLAVIDVAGVKFEKEAPGYWGNESASRLETYAPPTWPMDPPTKGEAIVTVGWPGKFRRRLGVKHQEMAGAPILGTFIDDVKENWFTVPFQPEYLISSDFDPSRPIEYKEALNGMSGSPIFVFHRGPILTLQLVGVLRTYGECFDVLYCTRADVVSRDGNIVLR